MFLTDSILLDLIAVTSALVVILITYLKWKHNHWARVGLEYPVPTFGFGNLWETAARKKNIGEEMEQYYFQMKDLGLRHAGLFFFHMPVYMPIDPEILRYILQVDFGHFVDRGVFYNEKDDPLSAHLFSLEGAKWRNLRAKLTPTFTSGKMKMMFPLVVKTSQELIGVMDGYSADNPAEIKDILARLTTDIIGTCAFGLDCNSLSNPDTEFRVQGKKVFQFQGKERFMQLLGFLFPGPMRLLGIKIIPETLSNFFIKVVNDTLKYRDSNKVKRNDFFQLLIQLRDKGTVQDETDAINTTSISKLTNDELAAQAFVFFIAGFETSSTTLSYCVFELATNEDVQEKMREEINAVLDKHNGEFTYEVMMDLKYMDMAINETLRKYPPLPILNRICIEDYKIPNTDVVLSKGTRVFIPLQGLQHDPDHYPNPQVFDPLRFTEENKRKRHPYAFLPFGEGPRLCIGMRFGMMQIKVGLVVLLQNYKVTLNSKTQLPLKQDPTIMLSSPAGGIWVNVKKIPAGGK